MKNNDKQKGYFALGAIRKKISITAIFLAGAMCSVFLYLSDNSDHDNIIYAIFEEQAEERIHAISTSIDSSVSVLHSVSGLFDASEIVTRDEFEVFCSEVLNYSGKPRSIQALEWIPKVALKLRSTFENEAKEDGFPDFQFSQKLDNGEIGRAKNREQYYPVFYVEPMAGNEKAFGFDLGSNQKRLDALNKSRDTDNPVATAKITLIQETGSQPGVLVFNPLYSKEGSGIDSIEKRRRYLTGFTLAVFRIGDIVNSAVRELPEVGLEFYIFDKSAEDNKFILKYPQGKAGNSQPEKIKIKNIRQGLHFNETIKVADRQWEIIAVATPVFYENLPDSHGIYYLLTGFVVTLLLTSIVVSSQKRTTGIQQIVDERTQELQEARKSLETKVVERTRESNKARKFAEDIVATIREPLLVLDKGLHVLSANRSFYKNFKVKKTEVEGKFIYELGNGQWNIPVLRDLLENLLPAETTIDDFVVEHIFEDSGRKIMLLNARQIVVTSEEEEEEEEEALILLAIEDITRRREQEEQHSLIATELRQFIETANAPIFGINKDGKVNEWNEAAERITGFKKEEVMGRNLVDDFITEEYKEPVGIVMNEALAGKEASNYEFPLYTKDEERVMVLLNATTRRDVDGNIVGVMGVGQDITELSEYRGTLEEMVDIKTQELKVSLQSTENTKEKLSESKKQLQINNKIADIFLTFSGDQLFAEVLDEVLKILQSRFGFFGYINENGDLVTPSMTREVMDKCRIMGKHTVFKRSEWAGIWGETLLNKETFVKNDKLLVPEGHVPLYSALTVPILHKETLIGMLAVANKKSDYDEHDILTLETIASHIAPILSVKLQKDAQEKARQLVESELQTSLAATEQARDRIDGILKSVADGLIVTDIYNRVILMNRAAEDLLEIRFSEVVDRKVDFAVRDDKLREKVKETLAKQTTGYQFDFELPGHSPEVSKIMRARTSVILDSNADVSGIVTILQEVTHEREVDRMKTEFISTAAHELRTPLTSIQGFSEILLTRDNLSPGAKSKYLGYINKQAMSLGSIINDLLDISRIESGSSFVLEKIMCIPGEAMSTILETFKGYTDKHQFQVDFPESPPELFCDKEKIGQVMKNLLSNAVKYSPNGGTISISGSAEDNFFQISISDKGIGMSPEQVERIFDKFYRADASNSAIEGTGLGMTIVKHIVEAHGGEIWVESEHGKGTTVTFTIPL